METIQKHYILTQSFLIFRNFLTAQKCALLMGKMADGFNRRSPARKLMDTMELRLLNGRKSEFRQSWNAEICAAKYLCALSLEYKGLSPTKTR